MSQEKKNLELSDSNSYFRPSYKELSNDFQEMHVEALNTFKRISSLNKKILKLDEEKLNLKNDLESMNAEHTSLVNFQFHIDNTLEENIDHVVECDTCPSLKLEIKIWKGQIIPLKIT